MIIKIKGKIKPYYIQALAMMFFPGEKFPVNEEPGDTAKFADIEVTDKSDGVYSKVIVKHGEKSESSDSFATWTIQGEDRTRKISVGRAFYEACVKLTGYRPPWGIMTGVRPSKIATELLDGGMNYDETVHTLEKDYIAEPAKAKLSADVACFEQRVITDEARCSCSVYVAIPFCPTRCSYCSFVSYTSPRLLSLIPDYLSALADDIDAVFAMIKNLGLRVSTVYIGGGTPTVLNCEQLEFLLGRISPYIRDVDEFTLEAGRPDTITGEKLKIAAAHGVGRISVNAQTLNDTVLEKIGRAHTAKQFFDAYETALTSDVPDINIDLIAGLPGDSFESFCRSVDGIIDLSPQNLTVHSFCVKKSAQILEDNRNIYDREGKTSAACIDYSQNSIMSAGYVPYYMYRQKNTVGNLENVGYSKPGHECLYNIYMMEEVHSIFACGASSVTKLVSDQNGTKKDIERIFEPKYPYEYLREHAPEIIKEKRNAENERIIEFYKEHKML